MAQQIPVSSINLTGNLYNPNNFPSSGNVSLAYLQQYYPTNSEVSYQLAEKLNISGGTVSGNILPSSTSVNLGSSSNQFGEVYATAYYGVTQSTGPVTTPQINFTGTNPNINFQTGTNLSIYNSSFDTNGDLTIGTTGATGALYFLDGTTRKIGAYWNGGQFNIDSTLGSSNTNLSLNSYANAAVTLQGYISLSSTQGILLQCNQGYNVQSRGNFIVFSGNNLQLGSAYGTVLDYTANQANTGVMTLGLQNLYQDTTTSASSTNSTPVNIHSYQQPILGSTNSSVTTTTASTLYVAGAPTGGTAGGMPNSQTITNPYGLYVDGGANTLLSGNVTIGNSSLTGTSCNFVNSSFTGFISLESDSFVHNCATYHQFNQSIQVNGNVLMANEVGNVAYYFAPSTHGTVSTMAGSIPIVVGSTTYYIPYYSS